MAGKRDEAAVSARGIALRCCYGAGVAAAVTLALNVTPLVRDSMGVPHEMLRLIVPAAIVGFGFVAAPLLLLTVRPYWWGKVFVLAPAFSWAGFAGALSVIAGWTPLLLVPLACAAVMLSIAIAHQILDPRFSGAPLA